MNASRRLALSGLLLLLCCAGLAASEPDYAREQRLAAEIVDGILDGDAQWLQAGERKFLGIYTAADDPVAAVIILHGRGFHPDWADTVNPLRVGLVARGYSTLSLQMPVLEKDALYYDYVPIFPQAFPRIEAGIRFLRERGYRHVVLLAHSCGVHMAMAWIRNRGDADIDAFIGLGMGATDYGQPMREAFPLERMRVPVLDLYGADEYPAVKRMAPERKAMIETAGHPASQQQVLADADHYFTARDEPLVAAVAAWLERLALAR